jgi:drug/metabolite transporter (DMT)-like permease
MQHDLLVAMLAGFGGMIGWGLADFFAKKTIDQIGDIATLAWAHVFGTAAFLIPISYLLLFRHQNIHFPQNVQTWGLLFFFGALQALVYLLVYSGFGKGQVAILSPIFSSFSGLTAAISIFIFGEIVSKYISLGLAAIFIGIFLINFDPASIKQKRVNFFFVSGFREIALATLLAVAWTLLWDRFITGNDWQSYTLFMYVFMTIIILAYTKLRKVNLVFSKNYAWKWLILIGVCEVGAYLSISLGYATTSRLSIVALLSGAFSLPTIFLARMFLNEKITRLQVYGGLLIIAGVAILSVL